MAIIKIPAVTIKNLAILLFLVIISFTVGLLGKLITNKPLMSTAQAQSCWTPPAGGGESCDSQCTGMEGVGVESAGESAGCDAVATS